MEWSVSEEGWGTPVASGTTVASELLCGLWKIGTLVEPDESND